MQKTVARISDILDDAERAGRLNLRGKEIAAAMPGISRDALRRALHRQQARGRIVRVSRGADHWVIVPLQFAANGAPPIETWLDRYLAKSLGTPYYVALLSAAEVYGASPQAVMTTQIMVPKPRRPVTVGRHRLIFSTRANIARMPARWHESAYGRFRVSSPELTLLELTQRAAQVGGLARVIEILKTMSPLCKPGELTAALEAAGEIPAAQRLGALFAATGQKKLVGAVARWLEKQPSRQIDLDPYADGPTHLDATFKVRVPDELRRADA
jgi:predicted transcriptional regulator of viral defense system